MGGLCANRKNGFYYKPVSLGLGNLENGLTRANLKKNGLEKNRVKPFFFLIFSGSRSK
jgi:hypothetical protein